MTTPREPALPRSLLSLDDDGLSLAAWLGRAPGSLRRRILATAATSATVAVATAAFLLELVVDPGFGAWIAYGLGLLAAWVVAFWLAARIATPTVKGLERLGRLCRDLDEGWRYQPDALRPPADVPRCVAELYRDLDRMARRIGSANERLRTTLEDSERLRRELESAVGERERVINERTLALQHANEELKRLAREDGLTGIANHRAFVEFADQVWRISMRDERPVSVLMIDVDHFKAYNDIYGHQAGDQCLKRIAKTLRSQVRRALDLPARYGGEEFAVILGDTAHQDALDLAERIRREVESRAIPHSGSPEYGVVTVSLGVATLVPMRDTEAATLISLADKALYRAKRHGRNRFDSSAPSAR